MKIAFFGMALRQFGKKNKGHIEKDIDVVLKMNTNENKFKIVIDVQINLLLQNT